MEEMGSKQQKQEEASQFQTSTTALEDKELKIYYRSIKRTVSAQMVAEYLILFRRQQLGVGNNNQSNFWNWYQTHQVWKYLILKQKINRSRFLQLEVKSGAISRSVRDTPTLYLTHQVKTTYFLKSVTIFWFLAKKQGRFKVGLKTARSHFGSRQFL